MRKKTFSIKLILLLLLACTSCDSGKSAEKRKPFTAPPPGTSADTYTTPSGYTLVWSDEFDGTGINLSNWSYETESTGWSPTWNSEWQRYSDNGSGDRNASINSGVLVIKAIKNSLTDGGITSARMTTNGKHSWQYGIVVARMQLPYGQGMWPAFWMLGNNYVWPACGEIDILEMIGGGSNDRDAHAALHWDNSGHQSTSAVHTNADNLADDWHYYECEWDATTITMRFDGAQYFSQNISAAEYDEFRQPFYLILNLAVGGVWPGPPDGTTIFPQYMYIDWVRVYQ